MSEEKDIWYNNEEITIATFILVRALVESLDEVDFGHFRASLNRQLPIADIDSRLGLGERIQLPSLNRLLSTFLER